MQPSRICATVTRMFVGHYAPSFAIRAERQEIPLWLLFVAAQLVDIAWAVLVLAGVERVSIVPGITAASPLDLEYLPYTHSLVAALLWSVAAAIVCRAVFRWRGWAAGAWVGATVFSHWVLDFVSHRPDLPLYGNSFKVGLGLWNWLWPSLLLEAAILAMGVWLYLRRSRPVTTAGRYAPAALFAGMFAFQLIGVFGPPPPSTHALAATALLTYLVLAVVAAWIDRQRVPVAAT